MYEDPNKGWLARQLERRRLDRHESSERERRRQEQVDELLAEYPVDRSRRETSRSGGNAGWADDAGGAGWIASGAGSDCGNDGGFLSSFFGGDWGGGDSGGGC